LADRHFRRLVRFTNKKIFHFLLVGKNHFFGREIFFVRKIIFFCRKKSLSVFEQTHTCYSKNEMTDVTVA
jgi:hypothetical protein